MDLDNVPSPLLAFWVYEYINLLEFVVIAFSPRIRVDFY